MKTPRQRYVTANALSIVKMDRYLSSGCCISATNVKVWKNAFKLVVVTTMLWSRLRNFDFWLHFSQILGYNFTICCIARNFFKVVPPQDQNSIQIFIFYPKKLIFCKIYRRLLAESILMFKKFCYAQGWIQNVFKGFFLIFTNKAKYQQKFLNFHQSSNFNIKIIIKWIKIKAKSAIVFLNSKKHSENLVHIT